MKISLNWLRNYIDLSATAEMIADKLTNCGLEVEGISEYSAVQGGLDGIVVGKVLEKAKHPNADKLSLTTVDIGFHKSLNIVCGASNVEAGQKVLVATIGTKLYPLNAEPFIIRESKIRGVVSEGMICAEDEVGLGSRHDGIMVLDRDAEPGMSAAKYFNIETDQIFEIGLTPNRTDAMSHIGVARDLKAAYCLEENLKLKLPDVSDFEAGNVQSPIGVIVEDPKDCIRYTGVSIGKVKVQDSPSWLQDKLRSIGLKPVNNIVDITNYVLYETGQPLHAFDQDKIGNKIIKVRRAVEGEKFLTLDSVERTLSANDLMICDDSKPLCIAGVFGGLDSGVSENTTTVFLESACFDPTLIRGTSKRQGLQTDASFRFERGTDPDATVFALKRAALLMKELCGAEILSEIVDIYKEPRKHHNVSLGFQNFSKLTGVSIEPQTIRRILESLEIKILAQSDRGMDISVPLYRSDVQREADVIEEILRIYGYNRVPIPDHMKLSEPFIERRSLESLYENISQFLVGKGFCEIMCNSLTTYGEEKRNDTMVEILNPLSRDLNFMRSNMLYPALQTVAYNFNHKNEDLQLFERGRTYSYEDGSYCERNFLSILLAGNRTSEHWKGGRQGYDIFYLKSLVDLIIKSSGFPLKLTGSYQEIAHPDINMALSYTINDTAIATVGAVKKSVLKSHDIEKTIFYAELDMDLLKEAEANDQWHVREVPRYPGVRRDLSMIIEKKVTYKDLLTLAFSTDSDYLREVNLFDIYEGDKIEEGKKSYALSFVLRDDRGTLNETQIDSTMSKLMTAFEEKLNARIRK